MVTSLEISKPLRRGEACICCRQQKTKCDGLKPSCTQCINAEKECGYNPPLSRLQKLEHKIRTLEDKIQKASSTSTSDNAARSKRITEQSSPIIDSSYGDAASSIASSSSTNFALPQTPNVYKIPGIQSWDHGSDVPVELRQQMLQIFIACRAHFLVDLYLPRLQASIILPSSDPDSIHPALMNAIFLGATMCGAPELQPYEAVFLQRTREELRNSLAFADRLDDFFWASIILSWYFMRSGRMLEAYDITGTIGRLALGCDMHMISDPVEYAKTRHGLLDAPRDKFHVGERINMWWSIYLLDRQISFAMSLPVSIPPGAIAFQWTTVFPRSFEEITTNGLETWPKGSYKELFEPGHHSIIATNDTLLALRAKSTVLLSCSVWRSHIIQISHPDRLLHIYKQFPSALAVFRSTLPAITDTRGTNISGHLPVLNPIIVQVHCCIYAASIYLHNINASNDHVEYRRSLHFAHAMAGVVRQAKNAKFMRVYTCLAPHWYNAAKVLVREIHRVDYPATPDEVMRLKVAREGLAALGEGMSRLTNFYPGLVPRLQRFKALISPNTSLLPLKLEDEEESPFFNPPYVRPSAS